MTTGRVVRLAGGVRPNCNHPLRAPELIDNLDLMLRC